MPEPLYRRIADDLRQQIESGTLAAGSQLPTEPELRKRYDASRNTVRDAVKWLITRGLVETRPGQGTFVTTKPNPFITTLSADPETGLGGGEGGAYYREVQDRGRTPKATDPRVEIQQARRVVADELRIPLGTSVVSRHQERFIDGLPYSLQTTFYPMSLVDRGADDLLEASIIRPGIVDYLGATLGIRQAGYQDKISVRVPNSTETTFFKLPEDGRVAVFVTRRTAFDETGTPFRLTVSVFPADRNRFIVNAGEVPAEDPIAAMTATANGNSGA